MSFESNVAGGDGTLIVAQLKSADYVPGSDGWQIGRDGSAEFDSAVVRGSITAGPTAAGHVVVDEFGVHVYDTLGNPVTEIDTTDGYVQTNTLSADHITMGVTSPYGANFTGRLALIADTGPGSYVRFLVDNNPGLKFAKAGSALPAGVPVGIFNNDLAIPAGVLAVGRSTAAVVATAAELQDAGVGTVTWTAVAGRMYRVRYWAQQAAATAGTSSALRIRAKAGATVALTDAIVAEHTDLITVAGGPGARTAAAEGFLRCPADIAAGQWTMLASYLRAAGGTTLQVQGSSGLPRTLSVEDIGSAA